MKKAVLISLIVMTFGLSYSVFSQSTFSRETLINAIENYVKAQNPNAIKIEIKQTLSPQKFSQKGVVASISHTGNLVDDSRLELVFSHNNRALSRLPVRINVISGRHSNNNSEFNSVRINKGDKVKMLHYSGAICIKMDGIAMENGNTGDVIKVKKDNSQTLYGFIAEDGNVIIENRNALSKQ